MTTGKLIVLRTLNATLCRGATGAGLLRRLLVGVLIRRPRAGRPYCASARYFDPRELD